MEGARREGGYRENRAQGPVLYFPVQCLMQVLETVHPLVSGRAKACNAQEMMGVHLADGETRKSFDCGPELEALISEGYSDYSSS